jgi:hypothetical protein
MISLTPLPKRRNRPKSAKRAPTARQRRKSPKSRRNKSLFEMSSSLKIRVVAALVAALAVRFALRKPTSAVVEWLKILAKSTWRGRVTSNRRGALSLVGNTPLIELATLSRLTRSTILAKCEFLNPGGSPKDRVALSIIEDAEARGLIRPGSTARLLS